MYINKYNKNDNSKNNINSKNDNNCKNVRNKLEDY